MSRDSPVVINNRLEIAQILNSVIAEKELVHVSGIHSRALLTTVILGIDFENRTLFLEGARSELMNHQLLTDKLVGCRTFSLGVRHEFVGRITGLLQFQGSPSLLSELPAELTRHQRREYFRLPLDRAPGATCRIVGPAGAITGKVLNLSVGGLAVEFDLTDCRNAVGRAPLYGRGVIGVPGLPPFQIDLAERFTATPRVSSSRVRVGFEFVGMPHELEAAVQRYITQEERNLLISRHVKSAKT